MGLLAPGGVALEGRPFAGSRLGPPYAHLRAHLGRLVPIARRYAPDAYLGGL